MIMLALQIFLLLLSAYLAGCMVGCILRRALYTPQPALAVPVEVPVAAPPARRALPAEAARFETALTGKPASPPAVAPPGEPVVEVRPRLVPAPQTERTGRGAGTAEIEIIKSPTPQPSVEPDLRAEAAQVESVAPVVVPDATPDVASQPSVPQPMGAPQMASYAAVAAAAAARAAAEAEAAALAPEADPQPDPEPIMEQATEPEAIVEQVSEPEPEPEPILEQVIAPEPVAEVADEALGAPQSEPVAISEVLPDGALETVPVEATEPLGPEAEATPESSEVIAPVADVVVSGSVDDLKRIRGIDQALEDRLNGFGVRRFSDVASWTSDDVARMNQSLGLVGRIEQENWIEQADILARGSDTNYSRRQSVAATTSAVGMAAAAASAAANATAQMSAGPDRFTRIIGIDPETEKVLYGLGYSHYSDIAQWTAADVERVEAALGRPGRVGLDNWIEQSRVLARYAGETVEARPVRLADAIRENKASKPSEPAAARTDMAGLRSVRSQALRGEGSAVGDRVDDLKRIRGIGVLIEKRLNALGITSYEQVANWMKTDIDSISSQLDFRGRIERENWVEQARILASGGQTEFSRRVDRGEVESSKDS